MPLRLTTGFSRKTGQPNYGSVGASCTIEQELEAGLVAHEPELLRERIRLVYALCAAAVAEELDRHETQTPSAAGSSVNSPAPTDAPHFDGDGEPDRNGNAAAGPLRGRRPATPAQLRAIRAISGRFAIDLDEVLREAFHVERAEELSLAEASQLIDHLRALASAEATG